jgi:beta-glucosidase
MTVRFRRLLISVLVASTGLTAPAFAQQAQAQQASVAHPDKWPAAASPAAITDAGPRPSIAGLMARMTLEEKVGQTDPGRHRLHHAGRPGDLSAGLDPGGRQLGARGGDERRRPELGRPVPRLPRGGGPAGRADPADVRHRRRPRSQQHRRRATIFPHNIGLGAARDPDLIRRIGEATAQEVAATGATGPSARRWPCRATTAGAAPTRATPRTPRCKSYAGPMTLRPAGRTDAGPAAGAGHIAGSAKHFLADGGTTDGVDQGDAGSRRRNSSPSTPRAIRRHRRGVLTVMASFSSWNGVKITGNQEPADRRPEGPAGLRGLRGSDWNAHGQLPGCSNESCPQAINAGLDMFMAPDSWKGLYVNTLAQARSGEIPRRGSTTPCAASCGSRSRPGCSPRPAA